MCWLVLIFLKSIILAPKVLNSKSATGYEDTKPWNPLGPRWYCKLDTGPFGCEPPYSSRPPEMFWSPEAPLCTVGVSPQALARPVCVAWPGTTTCDSGYIWHSSRAPSILNSGGTRLNIFLTEKQDMLTLWSDSLKWARRLDLKNSFSWFTPCIEFILENYRESLHPQKIRSSTSSIRKVLSCQIVNLNLSCFSRVS